VSIFINPKRAFFFTVTFLFFWDGVWSERSIIHARMMPMWLEAFFFRLQSIISN
jgi:hypothetical protein